jgi:RNA polymerase sigma-70 factor (ECF subfamily)
MDAALETVRKDAVALLPRLRRFALSLTGNQRNADDLVQEAVEGALRDLHRWQEGTRLENWMFRTALELWLEAERAGKSQAAASAEGGAAGQDSLDGTRPMLARPLFASTCAALEKLPAEQRVAVGLVCVDGMSYRDAAAVLGVAVDTLRDHLFRARAALAETLMGAGAETLERPS